MICIEAARYSEISDPGFDPDGRLIPGQPLRVVATKQRENYLLDEIGWGRKFFIPIGDLNVKNLTGLSG